MLPSLALMLALSILPLVGGSGPAARGATLAAGCTTVVWPWIRDTTATRFLIVGDRDSVFVGTFAYRHRKGTPQKGSWQLDTLRFYGRMARVLRVDGPDAAAVSTASRGRPERRILVLNYDQQSDCSWSPSPDTTPFPRVGDTIFLAAHLSPVASWIRSIPTLATSSIADMHRRGRALYAADSTNGVQPLTLSAAEYYAIYPVLSTAAAWERDARAEVERLCLWAIANPELAARPPMADNLRFMLREYREGGRRQDDPDLGRLTSACSGGRSG